MTYASKFFLFNKKATVLVALLIKKCEKNVLFVFRKCTIRFGDYRYNIFFDIHKNMDKKIPKYIILLDNS